MNEPENVEGAAEPNASPKGYVIGALDGNPAPVIGCPMGVAVEVEANACWGKALECP
jgi:hypothetical protein